MAKFAVIYDLGGFGHFNVRQKIIIDAPAASMYSSKKAKATKILKKRHPNREFKIKNIKRLD